MMRRTAFGCAFAIAIAVLGVPAAAQEFPGQPIRIIVPFPAGGVADVVARIVSVKAGEQMQKPIVIENKAGASAIVGTEYVAKARPDGYTLLLANLPVMSINALQYSNLRYDAAKDFTPIVMLADQPYIIAIHPSIPAQTMAEFIQLARQQPERFTFGTSSSSTFLAGELLKSVGGFNMTHVPYKGSAPALNDLLGGHISLTIGADSTLTPHVKSGRLRALAVTAPKRIATAPEIPTTAEAGLSGMEITSWQGIVAPSGTPSAIVEKLNAQFNRTLKSPEVIAQMTQQGVTPVGGTPAQFSRFVAEESRRWSAIAAQARLTKEKL